MAQVINKPTVPKVASSINDLGLVKKGAITPAVNQAAATVLANSARDFSWTEFNLFTVSYVNIANTRNVKG